LYAIVNLLYHALAKLTHSIPSRRCRRLPSIADLTSPSGLREVCRQSTYTPSSVELATRLVHSRFRDASDVVGGVAEHFAGWCSFLSAMRLCSPVSQASEEEACTGEVCWMFSFLVSPACAQGILIRWTAQAWVLGNDVMRGGETHVAKPHDSIFGVDDVGGQTALHFTSLHFTSASSLSMYIVSTIGTRRRRKRRAQSRTGDRYAYLEWLYRWAVFTHERISVHA
jgi:hypothetical protein